MIALYLEEIEVLWCQGDALILEAAKLHVQGRNIRGPGSDYSWALNVMAMEGRKTQGLNCLHDAAVLEDEMRR